VAPAAAPVQAAAAAADGANVCDDAVPASGGDRADSDVQPSETAEAASPVVVEATSPVAPAATDQSSASTSAAASDSRTEKQAQVQGSGEPTKQPQQAGSSRIGMELPPSALDAAAQQPPSSRPPSMNLSDGWQQPPIATGSTLAPTSAVEGSSLAHAAEDEMAETAWASSLSHSSQSALPFFCRVRCESVR
jgi:hypothetical protein